MLAAEGAHAQSAPGPGSSPSAESGEAAVGETEEIVITGEKGVGLAEDIPSSTASFDAQTLNALGVQDVSDLALVTPNLEINTISASTPTFFIRGIGLNDFGSNATGAVAIYQDGIPINAPALQLGQMFDVQGAEVLRGPQSYGNERNASAGMIRVSSRLPTGDFESNLRMDVGRFDLRDFEGALSLPLAGDGALSTRLAFRYTQRDPLVKNRCGGLEVATQGACGSISHPKSAPVPAGLPSEVNDLRRWAVRGLLRLQPPDSEADWLLNVHGAGIDQDSRLGQVIGIAARLKTISGYVDPAVQAIFDRYTQAFIAAGSRPSQARREAYLPALEDITDDIGRAKPFANDYNLIGKEKLDSIGGSLRGDLLLGTVDFQTITGMEYFDRSRQTDFDFQSDTTIESQMDDRAWQASQSVELESELAEIPLTWRAGGYFLAESLDSKSIFTFNFSRGGARSNQLTQQNYEQEDISFALYGNFEWEFHEAFELSAGARFNFDSKDFEMRVRALDAAGLPRGNALPSSKTRTWMAPSAAIALSYRPSDEFEVYAKYSRGWKPGVFNAAILRNKVVSTEALRPEIRITDPEHVDALEIGTRTRFLEETLEVRAALFYYKYIDYQVFTLKNSPWALPQFEIVNANDAQIYGAEVDLFAEPLMGRVPPLWEGLALEVRFSWLESKFLDFSDTRTILLQNLAVTQVLDFSGNRLPNTPRFKVSSSIRYPFELAGLGTLTPRYDLSYTDDVYFDASEGVGRPLGIATELPKFAVGQRAYLLHNVRLSYRLPNDRIEISGWVRNLTDERYKTYVADATASIESLLNWVGEPRTYGVSFSASW